MTTYEYERVSNESQPEVTYTQALPAHFTLKLDGVGDMLIPYFAVVNL